MAALPLSAFAVTRTGEAPPPPGHPAWLDTKQVAQRLGCSEQTLRCARTVERAADWCYPPAYRVGRRVVRYFAPDVAAVARQRSLVGPRGEPGFAASVSRSLASSAPSE